LHVELFIGVRKDVFLMGLRRVIVCRWSHIHADVGGCGKCTPNASCCV
jgi:hypothetical protein